MVFRAADKEATAGDAAAAAAAKPDESAAAAVVDQPAALRAKLLAALKLSETSTDDEISAALEALEDQSVHTLRPELRRVLKLADTASDTDVTAALIAAIEKLEGFESSAQTAKEAEIDAQLATLEVGDDTKAALREQMIADPAKAKPIFDALPKKKVEDPAAAAATEEKKTPAAKTEAKTPPTPKHDTQNESAMNADERAAAAEKLIATVRGEGKFNDYTSAREEARRRKPELFQ